MSGSFHQGLPISIVLRVDAFRLGIFGFGGQASQIMGQPADDRAALRVIGNAFRQDILCAAERFFYSADTFFF